MIPKIWKSDGNVNFKNIRPSEEEEITDVKELEMIHIREKLKDKYNALIGKPNKKDEQSAVYKALMDIDGKIETFRLDRDIATPDFDLEQIESEDEEKNE